MSFKVSFNPNHSGIPRLQGHSSLCSPCFPPKPQLCHCTHPQQCCGHCSCPNTCSSTGQTLTGGLCTQNVQAWHFLFHWFSMYMLSRGILAGGQSPSIPTCLGSVPAFLLLGRAMPEPAGGTLSWESAKRPQMCQRQAPMYRPCTQAGRAAPLAPEPSQAPLCPPWVDARLGTTSALLSLPDPSRTTHRGASPASPHSPGWGQGTLQRQVRAPGHKDTLSSPLGVWHLK